ncbi:MAG: mannose-6-phosphate isomerase, class I [Spirochaetales bacterium]|nr:mannose-6-phosphate isomerase, class I [Spirochaetales bacterium]
MFKLNNSIQHYDWGKTDWLPRFLGEANENNQPWAELWMGSHPKAPSHRASDMVPLDSLIEKEGEVLLGKDVCERFGRLPFLFKILAIEGPLSIQVHPSKAQAEEGFARENQQGIEMTAFNRNYKDDNHKPEIICAVEPYTAMKGFRSFDEIHENFSPLIGMDTQELFAKGTIRDFYFNLIGLDESKKKLLLERASERLPDDLKGQWVRKLMTFYPGDISALAPLYLNLIVLNKGEALFLPAGEMHAYLHGVGIELMANSDNVLRGGLTPKHMDLAELEKVVLFEHSPVHVLRKEDNNLYYSGADEFVLGEKEIDGEYILDCKKEAAIVLVFSGELAFNSELNAREGEVIFLEAGNVPVSLKGKGKIFWATVKKED